jgi:hypothetical protein
MPTKINYAATGFDVFAGGGGSSLPKLSRLAPTLPAGFVVSARLFYPPSRFIRIASQYTGLCSVVLWMQC